jgi:hypothetical protein
MLYCCMRSSAHDGYRFHGMMFTHGFQVLLDLYEVLTLLPSLDPSGNGIHVGVPSLRETFETSLWRDILGERCALGFWV